MCCVGCASASSCGSHRSILTETPLLPNVQLMRLPPNRLLLLLLHLLLLHLLLLLSDQSGTRCPLQVVCSRSLEPAARAEAHSVIGCLHLRLCCNSRHCTAWPCKPGARLAWLVWVIPAPSCSIVAG